jgi:EAL domain-containing protein (putative c-di-GMP-specific phosphodiesterase class I)
VGRNALTFFNHEMQVAIQERVQLEREMRTALEHQQFLLYYQMQVDMTHRPLGAEALIRWQHPERGLLSPAQFIPLAEELGLIIPIGQWVLETACAQLKVWEKEVLTRDLVLSVNVSAKEFHQVDFAEQIKALLQRYAIHPGRLKLELTESMLLDSTEDATTLMNTLKEMGVSFCLDDFGTGYSSLHYLKRLPVGQLKIDQSFVRDIVTDSSDKVIVCTIVVMAKILGIRVIAEGVETAEQYQLLLESGCTEYQGYLFGKPMPIEQFEALLKQD